MLRYLWLSLAVVAADQLTKWWALAKLHAPIILIPHFLDFTLSYNYGAAFSLLANSGGWQRYLFSGLAVAAVVGITAVLRRLRPNAVWLAVALAFVLGGAVGNLIDRIRLGYVIDFIHAHWYQHSWPIFNVADSAIVIGALMLVIDTFRRK